MEKQSVLITGASRGIGKEIAIHMARIGYNVIVNYCGSESSAKSVVEECIKLGSDAMMIKADVSDYDDVLEMVNLVIKKYGRIDILVNNSGITKDSLVARMSEEDFSLVIDVNLKGTFNCIKHVSRVMIKQKGGSIINMASVIGVMGNIGQANYAASKAGIIGLTKSCAKELAYRHIRVNAIAPGFIETDMTDKLDEQIKTAIKDRIPLKAFGKPQDIADLVEFLASNKSSYITGQVIHVDGGMVM